MNEQPKQQLPEHIKQMVDRLRAEGQQVEVITTPEQMAKVLPEKQLLEMLHAYRNAAYIWMHTAKREALRFWCSVLCNIVLLVVLGLRLI